MRRITSPVALAACLAFAPVAAAAPPNASFTVSPAAPHTVETVTFTSTSTGDITEYSWDLDNQGGCNDATGPTATTAFPVAGTYQIALCVVGPDGKAAQAQNVIVSNQEPAVSFINLPTRPKTGQRVTLVSTSKDPDGAIASQAWDLDGDGAFDDGSDVSASHAFPLPGRYAVSLQVTDSNGAQVATTQTIRVRAGLLTPFPTVSLNGVASGEGVRIQLLEVTAPRGARIRIRCRGDGCPPPRQPAASRLRRFKQFERTLGAGATLAVRVTKPGTIGKYTRFRVLSGRAPARRDLCLFPGRKRPRRCPST